MAYDEGLAERVRDALAGRAVVERAMFGGLALLLEGHMACGVLGDELVVRVGPDAHDAALARPHVRASACGWAGHGGAGHRFTGKPLRDYLYVAAEGVASDEALSAWVARGATFVATLPPKGAKRGRTRAATKRAATKRAATKRAATKRAATKRAATRKEATNEEGGGEEGGEAASLTGNRGRVDRRRSGPRARRPEA